MPKKRRESTIEDWEDSEVWHKDWMTLQEGLATCQAELEFIEGLAVHIIDRKEAINRMLTELEGLAMALAKTKP